MTRLRRPLTGLVALFTLAITIDRVSMGRDADAIGTFVYLIAATAVIAPLATDRLRRTRVLTLPVLALAAYAIAGTLSPNGVASPRYDVYVAATEVSFLILASVLSRRVAMSLADIEDTLGQVAFGASAAVDIEGPTAAGEIHSEMARSRRHGRPMSLTVLTPLAAQFDDAVARAAAEVERAVRERYVFGKLARAVGDQLRRSDLLFVHRTSGRLFILSPETDKEGTELLVRRVIAAADRAGVPAAAGSASFPDQAVGFEGLVAQAEQHLEARLAPPPQLHAVHGGGLR
ncbi:MAG: hypothetical protein A2135_01700 [Actinobacteria bacterium RBG_16_67_15]|nr:MAG: hypothetical protein A2135_01700 [Actinobacteria bacterium RBG_16_67_15]